MSGTDGAGGSLPGGKTKTRGLPVICVAPAPAIDRLEEVEILRPGAIHRPLAVTVVPGGKGLNVARAAHALGADVTAVGLLAGHAGRWVEAALAERGVRGRFAWVEGETRTCLTILDRTSLEQTEVFEPSPPVSAERWAGLLDVLEGCLASVAIPAVVTVSGGLPTDAPDDAFARVVRIAHARGARAVVDAYGPGLARALDETPMAVKVNAVEAAAALGAEEGADLVALAEGLRARGATGAIVTDGPRGAVLVDADGPLWMPPPPRLGRYPTGSGDAFMAGLAAGLADGQDLRAAAWLGAGAAAASALIPGAGELDADVARAIATELQAASGGPWDDVR